MREAAVERDREKAAGEKERSYKKTGIPKGFPVLLVMDQNRLVLLYFPQKPAAEPCGCKSEDDASGCIKSKRRELIRLEHHEIFIDECRKCGESPAKASCQQKPYLRRCYVPTLDKAVKNTDQKTARHVHEHSAPRKIRIQELRNDVPQRSTRKTSGTDKQYIFKHVRDSKTSEYCISRYITMHRLRRKASGHR